MEPTTFGIVEANQASDGPTSGISSAAVLEFEYGKVRPFCTESLTCRPDFFPWNEPGNYATMFIR